MNKGGGEYGRPLCSDTLGFLPQLKTLSCPIISVAVKANTFLLNALFICCSFDNLHIDGVILRL